MQQDRTDQSYRSAYRYLIPYVDVGREIGGDDHGIVSLDARATYVAPGRPCTLCTGLVTPRQIAFETLAAEERKRVVAATRMTPCSRSQR